jgi:hypothetical protein
MKIALALSGLARIFAISAASWGRIIGKYSPDVYIHSWQEPDMPDQALIDQLGWVFKPKQIKIDPVPEIDVSVYPDRHWPYINVDRSLSMWTGISRAHEMIKHSGIDYDLIIRGRMDFHVHALDIVDFPGVVLPYDLDKIPLKFAYRGEEMHGFNDHFAYGPPEFMDKYVSTLEEIPILYRDEGVDYCPENFLAANLYKKNVPVMLQHLEHCLIRS